MTATRSSHTALALVTAGLLLFGGSVPAQSVTPLDEASALLQDEQNTIDIVELYGPSVVAVNVEVRGERVDPFSGFDFFDQLPPEFRRFFDAPQRPQGDGTPEEFRQQSSGSGFVVDEDGTIISNYHVVQPALEEQSTTLREGAAVTIAFPDSDETVSASVVGANALYDLALLRLDDADALPDTARPIPIADSDEVHVGQKVIAIGNPFGFNATVTTGIVSGLSRSLPGVGEANIPLVQTDAAINPGNSGGPLLNSRGELIGINTAIIPGQGNVFGNRGNIGIGFAVPSNLLRQNLAELGRGGFVDLSARPRIGIGIADLDVYPNGLRESLNWPDDGVVVRTVEPGSAAEAAGLLGGDFTVDVNGQPLEAGGDVIIAVDGDAVTSSGQLQDLVLSKREGDSLTLTVWRDGEERTVPVTLAVVGGSESSAPAPDAGADTTARARLGVFVQDVASYPESVRRSLNLPERGVVVTEVEPDGPADAAGLRGGQFTLEAEGERYAAGGDVITAVDGQEVNSAAELQALVANKEAGAVLELRLWRNGEERTLDATLAAADADATTN